MERFGLLMARCSSLPEDVTWGEIAALAEDVGQMLAWVQVYPEYADWVDAARSQLRHLISMEFNYNS